LEKGEKSEKGDNVKSHLFPTSRAGIELDDRWKNGLDVFVLLVFIALF
jgi:hypothetical protein